MSKLDLLHSTQSKRNTVLWAAALALSPQLVACTHTLVFSDTSPLVVTGTPPPPKPAEPPPKPAEPPAPKRVEVKQDRIEIHEKIQFETSKAVIKPESGSLLDEITGVVKQNPQIKRLSIEGHTDSTGPDKLNQGLSDQRASAVRDYLTQHGVEAERLSSRGWGKSKPIGDNSTATGREENRRVEFVIVEQTGAPAEDPAAPAGVTDKPTAPVEGAP
jgi:outer membrane protein OmpA-like peptidoglycan-associated protein